MEQIQSLIVHTSAHRAGLCVHVRGPGTYANTVSYWQTIAVALQERQVSGLLLIDETTGAPLSAEEWQSLVDAMTGKGLDQVRIAHVKPRGLQRIEYCELYAREAGLDARVFTDEAAADLWLRYGENSRLA